MVYRVKGSACASVFTCSDADVTLRYFTSLNSFNKWPSSFFWTYSCNGELFALSSNVIFASINVWSRDSKTIPEYRRTKTWSDVFKLNLLLVDGCLTAIWCSWWWCCLLGTSQLKFLPSSRQTMKSHHTLLGFLLPFFYLKKFNIQLLLCNWKV